MRELWWMARGAWDHTAQIIHAMAEAMRNPDDPPYERDTFHPLRKSPERKSNVMPYNPAILKALAGKGD